MNANVAARRFRPAIATAALLTLAMAAGVPTGRAAPTIVGGEVSAPGQWPWQAALLTAGEPDSFDAQFCGGTLIDPEWVLTAAHCVEGSGTDGVMPAADLEIGLGMQDLSADDGYRAAVAQIVVHPDYWDADPETAVGDLALVRLAEAQPETARVRSLARIDDSADPAIQPGEVALTSGWGDTGDGPSAQLRHVAIPIVDPSLCDSAGEAVCAGSLGHDSCYGDSGGPLMVQGPGGAWRHAGLVSAGTTEVCGGADNYTLYTSSAFYADWIDGVMADTGPQLELWADGPISVPAGARFDYRLSVRNTGREPATGLGLRNGLPAGLRFVEAAEGGRFADGSVTWQDLALAPGATRALSYRVQLDPAAGRDARVPAASGGPRTPSRIAGPPARPFTSPRGEQPAVVGGDDAAIGDHPWLAAVIDDRAGDDFQGQVCGGALIEPDWVLTAASCLRDPFSGGLRDLEQTDLVVKLGLADLSGRGGQRIPVARAFIRARWLVDAAPGDDLALLQLRTPARINAVVQTIGLAGAGGASEPDLAGASADFAGWGDTSGDGDYPSSLQAVRLPLLDGVACADHADPGSTLCAGRAAGGRAACDYDEGGPLVLRPAGAAPLLLGVFARNAGEGCGQPGNPSLFARAAAGAAWLEAKRQPGALPDPILVNDDLEAWAEGLAPAVWDGSVVTVVLDGEVPATPTPGAATSTPGPSASPPASPTATGDPGRATPEATPGGGSSGRLFLPRLLAGG
ncbi:MAG: trypsin-like serine protease [Caldilineae bacterium]|nr:trypsin-like serine protease [Chloroflexota bacterium]MCB9176991.1 trypsin-like serine protease [Caldilineae bacterium]